MTTQPVEGTEIVYKRHDDGQPLSFLYSGMAPDSTGIQYYTTLRGLL